MALAFLDVLGVHVAGERWARSRTASIRAGVAAVLWATTRTRAGAEDSMPKPPDPFADSSGMLRFKQFA